jgi:acyl-coenzyme A thioesterase PaaI-like protein
MAIKSLLPEDTNFATVELGLRFHAPVRCGIVRAVVNVSERNERTIKGEVEEFSEDGVKVATFTSVFRIKKRA